MWNRIRVLVIFGASLYYVLDTVCTIQLDYNFITERPVLSFWNKSFMHYVNFSTARYSRQDPIYYVNIHIHTKVVLNDNAEIFFSIYEFLSNEYRPSFVELHFKWCKFIYHDTWFGVQLKRSLPPSCPHVPSQYHFTNMSVPSPVIPKGFPFTKGRIFCKITYLKHLFASGYIDLELKPKRRAKKQ